MKSNVLAVSMTLILSPAIAYAAPGDIDQTYGDQGASLVGINYGEFGPYAIDWLKDTVVAPNGDTYLVGSSRRVDCDEAVGCSAIAVARLKPSGQLDPSYANAGIAVLDSPGYDYYPAAAAMQSDGHLVISATAARPQPAGPNVVVCRLKPNGSAGVFPETEFHAKGCTDHLNSVFVYGYDNALAGSIAIDNDDRIVLSGTAYVDNKKVLVLDRLTEIGWPDYYFHFMLELPNANITSQDIAIRTDIPDYTIIAGATYQPIGSKNQDFLVVALSWSGTLVKGFGNPMTPGYHRIAFDMGGSKADQLSSIDLLPDGSIIAAGSAAIDARSNQFAIAKLTPNGQMNNAFGTKGKAVHIFCDVCTQAYAHDVAVQPDGRIVMAGTTQVAGSLEDIAVMRLLPNGWPDGSFGGAGRVFVGFNLMNGDVVVDEATDNGASVSLQNGKIIVGGITQTDAQTPADFDYVTVRLQSN